jgi:sulfofructose kinase
LTCGRPAGDHPAVTKRRSPVHERADVFGVGQCCLDVLGRVDAFPAPDTKCEVQELVVQGGGPVATALVALARWGLSCAFSGVVGDDAAGERIRASLDGEGVSTFGLVVRPASESQVAFIAAEPVTGRRTIFWRRPTGAFPSPEELDLARLRHARALHTDGLFIDTSLAAAHAARAAGVLVSVDAGSLRDGMLDLARLSDVFIASSGFARALVGGDDPREACRRLASLGPGLVGVTLGAGGYAAIDDGRALLRPAYETDVVDTTGCGDVFHAGTLYGLLKGWAAGPSLDFAAWAAARVATRLGGRAGIPAAAEWPGPRGVPGE